MQIGFAVEAAKPKGLRAAEDQPAQQSMRGDRKITSAPSTDQKRVRREMARKTADLKVQSDLYAEKSKTACPDCGSQKHRQVYKGWGSGLNEHGSPTYAYKCADCGHHHAKALHQEDPAWSYLHKALGSTAALYQEKSRVRCPDCGAKERKQTWTGHGSSSQHGPNNGWKCGSCGHTYTAPSDLANSRLAHSAGDVAEHDDVQAKDEFDPAHVEPGGGHHHHKPRTAMDYTALMNDVGDCRSCGGTLVRQPSQRGDTTVTANCSDCGMEHQLQESHRQTASLGTRTARQKQHLEVIAIVIEVDRGACPDCGSKGFGSKASEGHSAGSDAHGSYFNWHARCLDCGHRYKVPRDYSLDGRGGDKYGSMSWEPVGRYMPDPHTHMSAIARRAQSVLDTEEIQ